LSTDELRDVGMDKLKRRMMMQLLLRDPVEEGQADPTARDLYANRPEASVGGILPDRSNDTAMAMKPNKGAPSRMAPVRGEAAYSQIAGYQSPFQRQVYALKPGDLRGGGLQRLLDMAESDQDLMTLKRKVESFGGNTAIPAFELGGK
jgi:hypothetical protein